MFGWLSNVFICRDLSHQAVPSYSRVHDTKKRVARRLSDGSSETQTTASNSTLAQQYSASTISYCDSPRFLKSYICKQHVALFLVSQHLCHTTRRSSSQLRPKGCATDRGLRIMARGDRRTGTLNPYGFLNDAYASSFGPVEHSALLRLHPFPASPSLSYRTSTK